MPTYRKGSSKDKELKDPALWVCRRFLAVNLYARIDKTGNVTIPEFFILYCMKRARKVNLAFVLAQQLQNNLNQSRNFISICPLITRLAGSLDNFHEDTTEAPISKPMEYFDTARLSRMQIINVGDDGTFTFAAADGANTSQ